MRNDLSESAMTTERGELIISKDLGPLLTTQNES